MCSYFTASGGNGAGAYGVDKGNNGQGASTPTTIDFDERTFEANSGANQLAFKLANPVSRFEDLSTVEVQLNINRAGFATVLTFNTTSSGPAAYGFTNAGAITYTTASIPVAAPVTMTASTFYNRVVLPLPSSSTSGTRVAVRIILTAGTKTANTLLVDDVALTSGNSSPLPVELTSFAATAKGGSVSLAWATASEKNSERFDVQRSASGEAFETIGTLKGQGNSTAPHAYAFVDSKPLVSRAYYRLRQVDTNGSTAFSPVVTVEADLKLAVAYPNPSNGFVAFPAGLGEVQYRLYNAIGQTLLRGQATSNDHLDISTLPKGSYFLELTSAAGRTSQRLLHE